MGISDKLIQALNRTIELAGTQISLKYYSQIIDPVYDDDVTLTQSGTTLWTSGVISNLSDRTSSTDSVMVQQGKLIDSDKILYTNGSLLFTGSTLSVKIQIGSPTGEIYSMIPNGTQVKEAEGVPVYKKSYIRRLTTGSLIGEN